MAIPRPEYPRPQLKREQWMNLNGEWGFEIDHGRSGRERGLTNPEYALSGRILVPFCPESLLSGVEYKDFMAGVWYQRAFEVPAAWAEGRVLIHFGAVDYEAEVWINGESVGKHSGGYTPFVFDITRQLRAGVNVVTVCAEDDPRSGRQPRGKQSCLYRSHGCDYTRTTGIWQTVWLECVPDISIRSLRYYPDPENGCLHFEAQVDGWRNGVRLKAEALYEGSFAGAADIGVSSPSVRVTLPLSTIRLWEPGCGRLYDLKLTLSDESGKELDSVSSYFGLRTLRLDSHAMRINGRAVFQRLVLDQGFYPQGVYTAPTDEDLRRDIELSLELGFNGARLHEKLFEPRYLYWADRLGYLVWGEYGNWGLNISGGNGLSTMLSEWLEAVERDFNHPSVIGWCPFNETWDTEWGKQDDSTLRSIYRMTKALDPTRPVIDTSGNYHVETDIFDVHDYEQDLEVFRAHYEPMKTGGPVFNAFPERQKYRGEPYFVSEYGGIWWNPNKGNDDGWGYGNRPASEEEFLARYEGLTSVLMDHPLMLGFCYTQLYDVEQEVNGLYTYDRRPKFPSEVFRAIHSRPAAIERKDAAGGQSR